MGPKAQSAVNVLAKMAKVISGGDKEFPGFACNNGPNLRTLLDSAVIFPDEQRIYCMYQSFDTECREIALKTLGLVPISLVAKEKENAEYLLLAKVILPDEVTVTVNNGKTRLCHGNVFVGVYNPHKRFGTFHLLRK